mmetsp:Transcript_16825/g.40727  ORF Transcript_16825/g.40727 Transcript_16825/m.40727 type:complete len:547 (+) Transcript_16825:84-1724(+)
MSASNRKIHRLPDRVFEDLITRPTRAVIMIGDEEGKTKENETNEENSNGSNGDTSGLNHDGVEDVTVGACASTGDNVTTDNNNNNNNDDDNNNHDVEEGEDVHSNAWESAKNDRKYQAGQQQSQQQQQGSGERTHESSSTSTSTSWHQQDEEHAAGQQHNHNQNQNDQQQHWSDDTFDSNVSSMETAAGAAAGGGARSSRGQMRHNQHHASSSSPSCTRKMISCSCTVLRKLSRPQTLLNLIDWSVIILVVIYVVMLQQQPHHQHGDDDDNGGSGGGSSPTNDDLVLEFLSIGLATILFIRFIVTSTTVPCLSERRCSKNLTAHLTLGMCVSYGILGVTGWIIVSKLPTTVSPPWCPKNANICQEYPGAVPVVLVVLCVVEGMRWVYAQGVLRQYVQDHPDPTSSSSANTSHRTSQYPHSPGASSSHRSRNRPWWWNQRNQAQNGGGHDYDEDGRLEEPLIHGQPGWTRSGGGTYMVDDGVSTPRRSGGLFGWMNGGISSSSRTANNNHNNNDNPRDDGSVDYASLSEDWASRSEEDPYWWTQSDS